MYFLEYFSTYISKALFTYGNSFTTLFITKKYYITIILHFSSKIKILCELNLIILASLALH